MSARFMIAKKWLKQSTHVTSSGLRFVRYSFCVLFALSILTLNPEIVLAASDASVSTNDNNIENELTAFDKEAITSIREITLQLILVSVGVFAFVGGLVTGKDRQYRHRWVIWVSFGLLAVSVVCGVLTYGGLIYDLSSGMFNSSGNMRFFASLQWLTFAVAVPFLIAFFSMNIIKGEKK